MDISLISSYWGDGKRTYHHTAPTSLNFGLYEALRLVAEEGLEQRWKRHRENAEFLWQGLQEMGLSLHVEYSVRLPSLTTVKIPDNVDGAEVVTFLRKYNNIEISGGLGELAGKVWRIGLMGYNSRRENVVLLLASLKEALYKCDKKRLAETSKL